MCLEEQTVEYIKDCLCDKSHERSNEYYFGEDNTLKVRLIDWITKLRERIKTASANNENFLPKDALVILKDEAKGLSKIICSEFNTEGCTVGWINAINASCFCLIGNSDLFSASKNAKDLRIRFNDIIETKNGFKYKSSKGIYYIISLGYPLVATDDFFTVEETAAIIVHELGHGMQHVVNSLNDTVGMMLYQSLYLSLNTDDAYSYSDAERREMAKMLRRCRNAIQSGDKARVDKIVDEFFDTAKSYQGTSFSNMDQDKIQGYLENSHHSDWELDKKKYMDEKWKAAEKKRNSFGAKLKAFFGSIGSALTFFINIPRILAFNAKRKNPELNQFKVFEETADNFCQIYGLGLAQASAMRKFTQFDMNSKKYYSGGTLERIPFLDLYNSLKEIKDDYESAMAGYPTDKQRMMNLYRSCKFELQNNKDLNASQKAELSKQIEDYKKFYDDYVAIDSKKGWLYRLIAGLSRDNMEAEAKKDPYVYKHVLIPLQKRMDPNFDPYEAYSDILDDKNIL